MRMARPRPATIVGCLVIALLTWWAFFTDSASQSAAPGVRVSPEGVNNPVTAGEPLPDGFRQLLPRDAITPIYDPQFLAASDIGWSGNAQVIGVALGDEAKAYPVSFPKWAGDGDRRNRRHPHTRHVVTALRHGDGSSPTG